MRLRPHDGSHSQQVQDIVDDVFDLGLIVAAVTYDLLDVSFGHGILSKIAMAGAGGRVVLRRVFRVFIGPKIERWVERLHEPPAVAEEDPADAPPGV